MAFHHTSYAYAMTINKAQGQTLKHVGVFLPEPVFGHGQLYVALSRATSRNNLVVLVSMVESSKVMRVYMQKILCTKMY